jgi:diguanylate cyclase (GGDEF)-like protein
MVHAQRDDKLVAVMALDLDRFKIINDTFGHPVGDRLLQAVAERLASHVREGDTVARMGGDEFTFVLTDLGDSHQAGDIAQKILLSLAADPFMLEDKEIFMSASMGISVYPVDGGDTTSLIKNADAALYHAKSEGRNNFQYYAREMNASAMQRLTLESALRRALEREEFLLYYQPQIDLASGRIIGLEALLRWQHPERGLVSPGEFIPMLEETGLIVPVGEWVLHAACRQGRAWQQAGLQPIRIAVNLSALQFRQPDLVGMIERILAETGLDPSSHELELELTESLLMKNVEETAATLHRLHEMGVKLSIDDFGTGYSSLSYLKRFPLTSLKIDQSFVRDLSSNPDDAAIVSAIIALGHGLKLNVIAEGVETTEQLAYLREMKCDEMQGFLFSRPVPASEITQLLHEGKLLNLPEITH